MALTPERLVQLRVYFEQKFPHEGAPLAFELIGELDRVRRQLQSIHRPDLFEHRGEEKMGCGAAEYRCSAGDGFWRDEHRDGHMTPCDTIRALAAT